jgi:hypothetical protein
MAYKLSEKAEQVVYRTRRLVEGVECDICKKFIPARPWRQPESKYFRVTTGHNDWGNDSIESIEHYDICPNCINKFMTDYISDTDGTEYMNIETEHIGTFEYEYSY